MSPFRSLLNAVLFFLSGRLHFPRDRIGAKLETEDDGSFIVFRQVIVDPDPNQPSKPEALFVVQFRVAGMTPWQNKIFSLLPIPFIVGLPGFRSKLWTLSESGVFQGVYEWDTEEAAERYANSFAMGFMTRRSVPGSVSYRITAVSSGKHRDSGAVAAA